MRRDWVGNAGFNLDGIFLPWMTAGVSLFEVVNMEPGVVFEGGKGFVAEEFFDVVEVGFGTDHF